MKVFLEWDNIFDKKNFTWGDATAERSDLAQ